MSKSFNEASKSEVVRQKKVGDCVLEECWYSPGLRVPKHNHETANFCIALRGACSERFGASTRDYKPLSMDFLPAGEMHSLEIDAVGIRSFSIEIGRRWVDRASECSIPLTQSVHSWMFGLSAWGDGSA
jgi:hypothetical protein